MRLTPELPGAAHVHKCLINTVLLHIGRIFPQDFHKCIGALGVEPVVGRDDQQAGAFLPGLHQAFPGLDAAGLGRKGFGQNDAVPFAGIPAHRTDLLPQIHAPSQVLQPVNRFPGEVRVVYIYMKYNLFHEKIIGQNVCSVKRKKQEEGIQGEAGGWKEKISP